MIRAGAPKPDVSTSRGVPQDAARRQVDHLCDDRRQRRGVPGDDREDGDRRRHQGQGQTGRERRSGQRQHPQRRRGISPCCRSARSCRSRARSSGGVFPSAVQTYVVMVAGANANAQQQRRAGVHHVPHVGAQFRGDSRQGNGAVKRLAADRCSRPCAARWRFTPRDLRATRFVENPLITLTTSPSIGDNANGPTVIRVPGWVQRPLGPLLHVLRAPLGSVHPAGVRRLGPRTVEDSRAWRAERPEHRVLQTAARSR